MTDFSRAYRKYIMGKICEIEQKKRADGARIPDIQARLGRKFGYSQAGMKNIVTYSRAVDKLIETSADVAFAVLSGKIPLSYRNVQKLAKMRSGDIHLAIERLSTEKSKATDLIKEQNERPAVKKRGRPRLEPIKTSRQSVKDMPAYDPDAQISVLVYTIPSWVGTIDKAFMNTEWGKITETAKGKLFMELIELLVITDIIISFLLEG